MDEWMQYNIAYLTTLSHHSLYYLSKISFSNICKLSANLKGKPRSGWSLSTVSPFMCYNIFPCHFPLVFNFRCLRDYECILRNGPRMNCDLLQFLFNFFLKSSEGVLMNINRTNIILHMKIHTSFHILFYPESSLVY